MALDTKYRLLAALLLVLGITFLYDRDQIALIALDAPLFGGGHSHKLSATSGRTPRFSEQAQQYPGDPLDDSRFGLGKYSRSLISQYQKLIMPDKSTLENMLSGHRVLVLGHSHMQLIANVWYLTLGYEARWFVSVISDESKKMYS